MLSVALKQLRNDLFDLAGAQPEYRRGWNAGVQHAIRLLERLRVHVSTAPDYASAHELES